MELYYALLMDALLMELHNLRRIFLQNASRNMLKYENYVSLKNNYVPFEQMGTI